jgi:hypothetical protein
MRHLSAVLAAAAVALLLGGCKPRPVQQKLPETSDVFSTVVLPPGGTLVSRQGSSDALQLTFTSPMSRDTVANYYRAVFSRDPFVLVSDTKDREGAIALYAEEAQRPMWVRIEAGAAGEGSKVELSGAVTKKAARGDTLATSAAAKVPAPTPATPSKDVAPAR